MQCFGTDALTPVLAIAKKPSQSTTDILIRRKYGCQNVKKNTIHNLQVMTKMKFIY